MRLHEGAQAAHCSSALLQQPALLQSRRAQRAAGVNEGLHKLSGSLARGLPRVVKELGIIVVRLRFSPEPRRARGVEILFNYQACGLRVHKALKLGTERSDKRFAACFLGSGDHERQAFSIRVRHQLSRDPMSCLRFSIGGRSAPWCQAFEEHVFGAGHQHQRARRTGGDAEAALAGRCLTCPHGQHIVNCRCTRQLRADE
mmetsp:Transcript_46821/g.130380  ORF Transcript_46821/g.130380 Transcript_46821/m.130380 type:complete len:201 (-) Transcript_46821:94-696(-)